MAARVSALIILSLLGAVFFKATALPATTPPAVATPSAAPPLPKAPEPKPKAAPEPKPTRESVGIDLTNWKLTLPMGSAGHPTEIHQPQLVKYSHDPFFIRLETGGIRLRSPVTGVTTGGSKYPRSELREMTNNGSSPASWSATSGTHTLFLDQAITVVPKAKKHIVAGQVHGADDDVIVIRLEYPNLYINVDGKNTFTLDSNYTLGKRFTIKFVVADGQTKVYYNGASSPAFTLKKKYSGAYFKAGAYPQSNCSKEGASGCNADNFGEVILYQMTVTHQI